MSSVILIGIGNQLRGDDAAGIIAAERIAKRHPEVRSVVVQELLPELAEEVAKSDTVLFLDASVESSMVMIEDVQPDGTEILSGSHSLSPAGLLGLGRELYESLPRRAVLVHIPAESFELGAKPQPRTCAAIDSAVRLADSILSDAMAFV